MELTKAERDDRKATDAVIIRHTLECLIETFEYYTDELAKQNLTDETEALDEMINACEQSLEALADFEKITK